MHGQVTSYVFIILQFNIIVGIYINYFIMNRYKLPKALGMCNIFFYIFTAIFIQPTSVIVLRQQYSPLLHKLVEFYVKWIAVEVDLGLHYF